MIPLLAFGCHNGAEVLFQSAITGKPLNRNPLTMHTDDVIWVKEPFKIVDGEAVFGYSSAARLSQLMLNRLLTVRSEWSRK